MGLVLRGFLLKLVGQVEHHIGRRTLVLHVDKGQLPPLSAEVTDRRLQPIGKLVEIFGNVQTPYATVLCYTPRKFVRGEKIYMK